MVNLIYRIRHSLIIEKIISPRVAIFLHKLFNKLLGLKRRGIRVLLGGNCVVYMPAFMFQPWDKYETPVMIEVNRYIKNNPNTLFLDIGCQAGIFSVFSFV